MQHDERGGVTFYPLQPAPLKTWLVAFGVILFLWLIVGFIWRFRRQSQKTPGSLDINAK